MRLGPCRFDSLSIYCVFMYYANVFFSIESEYDICLLKKSIKKKLSILCNSLSLFNTEETKILIIAIYYMKRRITQPMGLVKLKLY